MAVKRKIKNTPRQIIFWAVSNYLSGSELEALINDFTKGSINKRPKFLETIARHFDIERFHTDPVFWQDIWLYNYIIYDIDGKMKRNQLIVDYENTIMIPTINKIGELKSLMIDHLFLG